MKKLACFILSYEITKGMKSVGPKGLLKSKKSKELIRCQIENIKDKNIDINIILGFGLDKIKKKIENENINIVYNDLYETANQGYALELILNHYDFAKYDGCIIIDSGILFNENIKKTILSEKTISKIFYTNECTDSKSCIGITFNDTKVEHMFYNLNKNIWNEILFINNQTLFFYKEFIYNIKMRNMFLFEIINKSIDYGAHYQPIKAKKNNIIKILNSKDSSKIKEKIT